MCGCTSNFSGNRPSEIVTNDNLLGFDGGGSWTDFVDDLESGDKFDNFLTKKMRERRAIKKELVAGGLTKQEAQKKALEQVPRTKLKEIIAKLKQGQSVVDIQTPSGNVRLSSDPTKALDEVSDALANSGSNGSNAPLEDVNVAEAGFLGKNGKMILIGAVVLIGGYFAWKKFGK